MKSNIGNNDLLEKLYPGGFIFFSNRQPLIDSQLPFFALDGFPKFRSIAALMLGNLSIPTGLLVFKIKNDTFDYIDKFLTVDKIDRALIRSDTFNGRLGLPSKQGVPKQLVFSETAKLLNDNISSAALIQSTGNIFRNLWNINILFSKEPSTSYLLEVNGPGFTATDLNRGGLYMRLLRFNPISRILKKNL